MAPDAALPQLVELGISAGTPSGQQERKPMRCEHRADLLVLVGLDLGRPPLATIKLPFALPMAFLGCWMPG